MFVFRSRCQDDQVLECTIAHDGWFYKWFFIGQTRSKKQVFPISAYRHVRFPGHSGRGAQRFKQVATTGVVQLPEVYSTTRELNERFWKGFFRYSWKNVLLIYDIDGYWKVSGKQSCGLMTKTLVEMFKGNASIRYDAFDLAKNPQNNLTENLRNEVGSKHTSKHCTFIIICNKLLDYII